MRLRIVPNTDHVTETLKSFPCDPPLKRGEYQVVSRHTMRAVIEDLEFIGPHEKVLRFFERFAIGQMQLQATRHKGDAEPIRFKDIRDTCRITPEQAKRTLRDLVQADQLIRAAIDPQKPIAKGNVQYLLNPRPGNAKPDTPRPPATPLPPDQKSQRILRTLLRGTETPIQGKLDLQPEQTAKVQTFAERWETEERAVQAKRQQEDQERLQRYRAEAKQLLAEVAPGKIGVNSVPNSSKIGVSPVPNSAQIGVSPVPNSGASIRKKEKVRNSEVKESAVSRHPPTQKANAEPIREAIRETLQQEIAANDIVLSEFCALADETDATPDHLAEWIRQKAAKKQTQGYTVTSPGALLTFAHEDFAVWMRTTGARISVPQQPPPPQTKPTPIANCQVCHDAGMIGPTVHGLPDSIGEMRQWLAEKAEFCTCSEGERVRFLLSE